MAKQQRERSTSAGVIAGIAAVAVIAGGGVAWWTWNSTQAPTPPTTPNAVQPSPTIAPKAEQTAQVFWLKDTGSRQELVPQPIETAAAPQEPSTVLKTAFDDLLAGPKTGDMSTTIPAGTQVRDVQVQPDGVHVDLSSEFTSGGGSAAMTGRIAQVIYTATSLSPDAKVWIDVEGKPLEILGGEGLVLEQPLTRESFEQNFTL